MTFLIFFYVSSELQTTNSKLLTCFNFQALQINHRIAKGLLLSKI